MTTSTIDLGAHAGVLYGLDAIGPANVWAVGFQNSAKGRQKTLVVHYDGIAWSKVPELARAPVHDSFVKRAESDQAP